MKNKRLFVIFAITAILLLIPIIAMQFTEEVNWTFSDFIVAGVLLVGTGVMCEITMRKIKKLTYRIAICATLLLILFLIWAELAVGIF